MDINSINSNNITFNVDYSIEKVQETLAKLFEKKSMLYILEKEKSTLTNYKLDVYNGINPASMSISLTKIDDQHTTISAIAQNAQGGKSSDQMLKEILRDFVKIFPHYLEGKSGKKGSGCMGKAAMITIVFAVTTSLIFII